jgi:cytochrome c oxidase subunit 2
MTRAHFIRIALIWAALSLAADLIVVFVVGSSMPPGRATSQSSDQTTANLVLTVAMTPIMLAVWVYFFYALFAFRVRDGSLRDGAPIIGHRRLEVSWVGVTTIIVLGLAAYGTWALYATTSSAEGSGAGGGQGATPIVSPSGHPLQVQVIAQQWQFTYRFPQYGGVETFSLALPVNRTVELHVTSLDVVHSFWAYQLGVKADAVPGADNIVFVTPKRVEAFAIRCAELCGLWHGEMHAAGQVLSDSAFNTWIHQQVAANKPISKYLPKYGRSYYPVPYGRAG